MATTTQAHRAAEAAQAVIHGIQAEEQGQGPQATARQDFKFWLDGIRFWAAALELASDGDARKRAVDGIVRCHQIATGYLDILIERHMED